MSHEDELRERIEAQIAARRAGAPVSKREHAGHRGKRQDAEPDAVDSTDPTAEVPHVLEPARPWLEAETTQRAADSGIEDSAHDEMADMAGVAEPARGPRTLDPVRPWLRPAGEATGSAQAIEQTEPAGTPEAEGHAAGRLNPARPWLDRPAVPAAAASTTEAVAGPADQAIDTPPARPKSTRPIPKPIAVSLPVPPVSDESEPHRRRGGRLRRRHEQAVPVSAMVASPAPALDDAGVADAARRLEDAERRIAQAEARLAEAEDLAETSRRAEVEIATSERDAEALRRAEAEQRLAEAEQRLAEAERAAQEALASEAARAAQTENVQQALEERAVEAQRRAFAEQRLAEAERRLAELEQTVEAEQATELARLTDEVAAAEAQRSAEVARLAEAERAAEEALQAEAQRRAELERQLAETERRLQEAEEAAELARRAEAERAAEAERLAAQARAAEAERLAATERAAAAERAAASEQVTDHAAVEPAADAPTELLKPITTPEPEHVTPAHALVRPAAPDKPTDKPTEEATEAPAEPKRGQGAKRVAIRLGVLVAVVAVATILLRAFVIGSYYIPSASMEPTLHGCPGCNNDHVLVNKLSYKMHSVHRGDVVVFGRPPGAPAEEKVLIKRVIGLPGDTLTDRGGVLFVNGLALDEPYLNTQCHGTRSFPAKGVKVPEGSVFVMGDNRCNSTDSRVFGSIPTSSLIGRAFVIIWPIGRVHYL